MRRTLALAGSAGKVAVSRLRRPPKAAIEVTEAAARRLQELLSSKPEAIGIRLGVKQRGCNGVSYTMNYAASKVATDEEVVVPVPPPVAAAPLPGPAIEGLPEVAAPAPAAGAKLHVFIEPAALMKIVGTTMDWKEDDLAAEFIFSNPNAKSVCGCGESFNV